MSKVKYKQTKNGYEKRTYDWNGDLSYYVILEGNIKTEGDGSIGLGGKTEIITKYDNNKRAVQEDVVTSGGSVYGAMHIKRYFKYNEKGDVVAISDTPNGKPTWTFQYTYDGEDNWIEKKDFSEDKLKKWTIRTIVYARNDEAYDSLMRQDRYNLTFTKNELLRANEEKAAIIKNNELQAKQQKLEKKRADSIGHVNNAIHQFDPCRFLFDSDEVFARCVIRPPKEMEDILLPLIENKLQEVYSIVVTGKEIEEPNNKATECLLDIIYMANYMERNDDFPYHYYDNGVFVSGRTRFTNIVIFINKELDSFVLQRKYLKKKFNNWQSYWNVSKKVFLEELLKGNVK